MIAHKRARTKEVPDAKRLALQKSHKHCCIQAKAEAMKNPQRKTRDLRNKRATGNEKCSDFVRTTWTTTQIGYTESGDELWKDCKIVLQWQLGEIAQLTVSEFCSQRGFLGKRSFKTSSTVVRTSTLKATWELMLGLSWDCSSGTRRKCMWDSLRLFWSLGHFANECPYMSLIPQIFTCPLKSTESTWAMHMRDAGTPSLSRKGDLQTSRVWEPFKNLCY